MKNHKNSIKNYLMHVDVDIKMYVFGSSFKWKNSLNHAQTTVVPVVSSKTSKSEYQSVDTVMWILDSKPLSNPTNGLFLMGKCCFDFYNLKM